MSALKDCRHVSDAYERGVLVSGEHVVRGATRLPAGARRTGRDGGSLIASSAFAVARAALREA